MEEIVFTYEQGVAIKRHVGKYDHIELIDKELISEWVDDMVDPHFSIVCNPELEQIQKDKDLQDDLDQQDALSRGMA